MTDETSPYHIKVFAMEIVAFVKKIDSCRKFCSEIRHAAENATHYDPSRIQIFKAENLLNAVRITKDIAKQGDSVLFSPACVKFDGFENHYYCGVE